MQFYLKPATRIYVANNTTRGVVLLWWFPRRARRPYKRGEVRRVRGDVGAWRRRGLGLSRAVFAAEQQDRTRSIRESACIVPNYRESPPQPPVCPPLLTGTGGGPHACIGGDDWVVRFGCRLGRLQHLTMQPRSMRRIIPPTAEQRPMTRGLLSLIQEPTSFAVEDPLHWPCERR